MKKTFLTLKYFFNEEKWCKWIAILSIALILLYIFTNHLVEIIPFGVEFMVTIYDVSIAFLTGIIFYFFQVFLPNFKKRKNAQRELNGLINNLVGLVRLIINNYYSKDELYRIKFSNNPQEYIFNNIDELSKYIAKHLKLSDIIKFKWNEKEKLTLLDEFSKVINKFTDDYREIVLKYGDCLEENTLNNLENINRNYIFISLREDDEINQSLIHESTIKKLLENMCVIQKAADKINNFYL